MNAIKILRAASRSVPNEDYVQFMAAVDGLNALIEASKVFITKYEAAPDGPLGVGLVNGDFFRLRDAIANVGGAA